MKHLDSGHLATFLGHHFDQAVFEALAKAGFSGVRGAHGFVIQRLLEGPQGISAMARQLGVTQQAVSKQVAELIDLGLVESAGAAEDGRAREVRLSKRGRACVTTSRRARAQVTARLTKALGATAMNELHAALSRALDALGGLEAVQRRRVRPPPTVA
ncbi:MAG: winged helix-turn-helix transcriptional regulator [Archangiaceae bacterium]|nr:winged helix-turn-helix transcriptional regulator [Archangiaceae bacterium]